MLYPVWALENQFQNKNGSNLVNGKVYVYHQGRSTLANIFQDEDGNFAQSNPVTLDANARGVAYADSSFVYTIVVCDFYNKELFSYDTRIGGAGGTSGSKIVIHDVTLSGYGTTYSPLGVVTLPLAVDETMTAYTANVGGKESLVLGVEGDWFNDTFGSAFGDKVDTSAFEECCNEVNNSLSGKVDLSALNNYYNKTEINSALGERVTYEFLNDNVYKKYQTSSKEELASAFASAGQGDSTPWISGAKIIADTQTLTSNMVIQVLSSFDLSGNKNHFIGMKGGTYKFPNEYEIGSALLHTNYFMHLSGMSAYVPLSSFSSYTASIANNLENNWLYTNSAYTLSINNFYNKLDASAFSSYSAGQDTTINNITEQITNISNASGYWNDISAYQQNSANYLTGINIPESASWNEATNVVQTNSSTIINVDNVVQANSAQWAENTGDTQVNNYVYNNSGINNEVNNVVTANSGVWNNVTNKLDTTAFTAWSSTIFSGDYELSAGEGISITDDVPNRKTIITNNISAGTNISLVYDQDTNKIRIDSDGKTYSGVAPIQVNNSTNQISITGESLSAGPGIDIFSSGGYVVISANGGNTYCYNFPNGVTSVNLANFNNYDKVTVVHNRDNGPDYNMYWDGKTKVMPSGFYCEMVKGTDNQNNITWSFVTSGWTNDNWWDWD